MVSEHCDIIALEAFKNKIKNNDFVIHYFTDNEQSKNTLPHGIRSLAGRYLVKKCILEKLLQGENKYRELEIRNDEMGKPILSYSQEISELLHSRDIKALDCSITHSRNWVAGFVVIQKP